MVIPGGWVFLMSEVTLQGRDSGRRCARVFLINVAERGPRHVVSLSAPSISPPLSFALARSLSLLSLSHHFSPAHSVAVALCPPPSLSSRPTPSTITQPPPYPLSHTLRFVSLSWPLPFLSRTQHTTTIADLRRAHTQTHKHTHTGVPHLHENATP